MEDTSLLDDKKSSSTSEHGQRTEQKKTAFKRDHSLLFSSQQESLNQETWAKADWEQKQPSSGSGYRQKKEGCVEFFSPLEEFLFQEMSDLKIRQKRAKKDLFQQQRRLRTRHHWNFLTPIVEKSNRDMGCFRANQVRYLFSGLLKNERYKSRHFFFCIDRKEKLNKERIKVPIRDDFSRKSCRI